MYMGKSRRLTIMSAASLLMMLSCLGHGWAQTVKGPCGLALDASGNLYVANFYSDQVLVYNPNYVQQSGKTISSEVSGPVGVALDSKGNVYVANQTSNSVTQYSPAGVLNTRFSISGINVPYAIAIDGVDDLYVLNAQPLPLGNVMVFTLADTIYGPFLLRTITPTATFPHGVAVHAGDLYIGTDGDLEKGFISELLAGAGGLLVMQSTFPVMALATDRAGDLYDEIIDTGNGNNEVDVWTPKGGPVVFLSQLSFTPAGMVVDSARGRVYLSNQQGNQVLVYSTNGTLLHTIK